MPGQNTYELTYIVNAVLNDDHIKDIVGRVNKFITEHGGEVLETDEWGTRRLAYPLNKKRNGYYVNVYFRAGGEMIQRLERALEIEDDVMRYITLRFDSKMLRHYEQQKSNSVRPRGQAIETAAPPRPATKREEDEEED
jgi:small subunit ribosomal protein S6